MSTPYDRAVALNMAHLKTRLSDWKAVPSLGMEEDEEGRQMPTFDFDAVRGYQEAPTLYRGDCCGLCSHPIKTVYWIRHDPRRWTMRVGSECIARFQEDNGETMAKAAQHAANLARFRALYDLAAILRREFRSTASNGYGSTWETWNPVNACPLHLKARAALGKVTPDSTPAALTRWTRTKGQEAAQIAEEIAAFLALDYIRERREGIRRAEIDGLRRELETGQQVTSTYGHRHVTTLSETALQSRRDRIAQLREEIRELHRPTEPTPAPETPPSPTHPELFPA